MKKLTRRVAAVAAGACLAAVAAASPASAHDQASGTFFYQGVLTGSETITNPILGNCYALAYFASSGENRTNAVATVYVDGNCELFGVDVNPGDGTSQLVFSGVVFHEIR